MTIRMAKRAEMECRPPIGAFTGEINVGKTACLAAAFPDWLYMTTRRGALDGIRTIIQKDPELAEMMGATGVPEMQLELINDRTPDGGYVTPWLNWVENFCRFIPSLKAQRVAKARQLHAEGKLSPEDKDRLTTRIAGRFGDMFEIPEPGVRGIVISEASTLWDWITEHAKHTNKQGYELNARIQSSATELISAAERCKIGLIFDSHLAEASEERNYPRAPRWPYGSMRKSVHKNLDFCWELCLVHDDEGKVVDRVVKTSQEPGDLGTLRKTSAHRGEEVPDEFSLREMSVSAALKKLGYLV